MSEPDLATAVGDVLAVDPDTFQDRVHEDAKTITAEVEAGTFDNPQAIVGLEYEFYAVDDDGALARIPRRLLEYVGFEKELGLHNAEMQTFPDPLNDAGLQAQEASVRSRIDAAARPMDAEGLHLVSDGIWTRPPAGESTREYLTGKVEREGLTLATNMSDTARYHAMANTAIEPGMTIDVPHVSLEAETVMPESLITSIQPHYQVPRATDLPEYFRYAVRVAGPLLALGVNSPFLPPDLYEDVDPYAVLEDGYDEHRIDIFESVLNVPGRDGKVRFPEDIGTVEDAITAIAEDDVLVPMAVEKTGRFDDEFAHFRMKHGTFWRWVRPVFEGASRTDANARIEFRPIPAQPTVRDSVAFQAAFAGLLEQMRQYEHPLYDLPWDVARENFYAAMRDGLRADLTYLTADGTEATEIDTIFGDLLEQAQAGLRRRGLTGETAARYLWPLRRRVRQEITPASWKRNRVREHLQDGADLETAVGKMQETYVQTQRRTLLSGSFSDWFDTDGSTRP
ncbi:hypothetical protein RH831_09535 [Halodesulfurarchaeum sp. HSR-GB]|uniref:hypothetical protein n=1 Tax=Halodesulfurarchaeum sp. HSR-GB TaxID=3074077 RepID=UPI0028589DD5|nr:hypothetical protein [Halodesulfurarchaeum sp. HSR-GB]MDR5657421.1 hypothetical protein [Halodesulfurarchaeum sp. HSR-GB]